MDFEVLTLQNFLGPTVKVFRDYDQRIIVNGDINISVDNNIFSYMPVKIYILNGNLYWHSSNKTNNLTSLKNFPTIVNGDVVIYGNHKLTHIDYFPEIIKGNFECDKCMIENFDGIRGTIEKNFTASFNPLKDIKGLSNVSVGGKISLVGVNKKVINEAKKIADSSIIVEFLENDDIYMI